MGVVVQQMVNSRCSGVMFTRSPLTGDRSVIVIETSWGLGSAVVSGVVTPDRYVMSKVTGEVVKRAVSHKTVQHVPDLVAGGVREIAVPDERRTRPASPTSSSRNWRGSASSSRRTMARRRTSNGRSRRDAGGEERLYLLQSRPETIWANKEAKPAATPKPTAFAHVFELFGGAKTR